MTCLSFFGLRLGLAGGCLLLSSPRNPTLQPVAVDINDRCRIEGQNLRHSEAADDGIADRMANLRTNAPTQYLRHGTEQRRHRAHQDRPKAEHASPVYRFLGRQAFAVFDLLSKI